ncbi:MAG: hypothetical protein A49_22110 [Methyloceanibacter sp.]|nr:MAG: hypothetical protein A49_22110 [Methyloceanibacter sp.]
MLPLSVEDQDRKLRDLFPEFRLVLNVDWIGIWEGPLTPICQTYRVRVVYFRRRQFDTWSLANHYVTVTVLDPPIGPDPRGTGERVPHVYSYARSPKYPALCLFDHRQDEWLPDEFVADKIIPWAIKWLFYYELWLATGTWLGGGRHPEIRESAPCLTKAGSDPANRARRERSLTAAFHRLGQRIGVFASSLLMEAASAGSFPPRSWRALSGLTPAEIRSALISTLSPALDRWHHCPRPRCRVPRCRSS